MRLTKQILRKIIKEEYIKLMEIYSDLDLAKKEAKKISKEEGVVQHVNEKSNGKYEISDWYDDETTIASYENGREL